MEATPEFILASGGAEVFPQIYEDMKQQFPPCELYRYETFLHLLNDSKYRILLYRRASDRELLGYALVFTMEESNVLWIDYLAVLKKHQSQGLGKSLFRALWQKFCGPFNGLLFSVEFVSETDPVLAGQQRNRISFYEHLGAYRLSAGFLQPCDEGSFPMYLYFKPRSGVTTLSRTAQMQSITQMYDYCFFHLKHRGELLPGYESTIVDEQFND